MRECRQCRPRLAAAYRERGRPLRSHVLSHDSDFVPVPRGGRGTTGAPMCPYVWTTSLEISPGSIAASALTPQQNDRKRHQAQHEEYAQQGHHDAQRVRTKDADERLRGACAPGSGIFGPNAGAALLLVIVQRAFGGGEIRVLLHPDPSGRDTPETWRRFVIRDVLRVEHRAHVVGLVTGHIAQIQKQPGHGAMLVARGMLRSLLRCKTATTRSTRITCDHGPEVSPTFGTLACARRALAWRRSQQRARRAMRTTCPTSIAADS